MGALHAKRLIASEATHLGGVTRRRRHLVDPSKMIDKRLEDSSFAFSLLLQLIWYLLWA